MNAQPYHSRRAGFTLIEMLVVMWTLSITMTLGVLLLIAAMRADQVSAATMRGLTWRIEMADQFRADVARAVAAPEKLDDLTSGPACLILRTPDGTHVVYQCEDGQLERIVRATGGESRRNVPIGSQPPGIEFVRTEGDRPLITLRLNETLATGVTRRTELSAALGGNQR